MKSRKNTIRAAALALLLLLGGCVYAKYDNIMDSATGILIGINVGACRFNLPYRFNSGCVFR